jgi:hypothetical protein
MSTPTISRPPPTAAATRQVAASPCGPLLRLVADRPISLKWFFALTFGLGWGVASLMMLFTDTIEAIFGPIGYTNPVFVKLGFNSRAQVAVWVRSANR